MNASEDRMLRLIASGLSMCDPLASWGDWVCLVCTSSGATRDEVRHSPDCAWVLAQRWADTRWESDSIIPGVSG